MKVEIRQGDDWIEVHADGKCHAASHSISTCEWVELLRQLGAEVTDAAGTFCECGEWLPKGEACESCAEFDRQDAEDRA